MTDNQMSENVIEKDKIRLEKNEIVIVPKQMDLTDTKYDNINISNNHNYRYLFHMKYGRYGRFYNKMNIIPKIYEEKYNKEDKYEKNNEEDKYENNNEDIPIRSHLVEDDLNANLEESRKEHKGYSNKDLNNNYYNRDTNNMNYNNKSNYNQYNNQYNYNNYSNNSNNQYNNNSNNSNDRSRETSNKNPLLLYTITKSLPSPREINYTVLVLARTFDVEVKKDVGTVTYSIYEKTSEKIYEKEFDAYRKGNESVRNNIVEKTYKRSDNSRNNNYDSRNNSVQNNNNNSDCDLVHSLYYTFPISIWIPVPLVLFPFKRVIRKVLDRIGACVDLESKYGIISGRDSDSCEMACMVELIDVGREKFTNNWWAQESQNVTKNLQNQGAESNETHSSVVYSEMYIKVTGVPAQVAHTRLKTLRFLERLMKNEMAIERIPTDKDFNEEKEKSSTEQKNCERDLSSNPKNNHTKDNSNDSNLIVEKDSNNNVKISPLYISSHIDTHLLLRPSKYQNNISECKYRLDVHSTHRVNSYKLVYLSLFQRSQVEQVLSESCLFLSVDVGNGELTFYTLRNFECSDCFSKKEEQQKNKAIEKLLKLICEILVIKVPHQFVPQTKDVFTIREKDLSRDYSTRDNSLKDLSRSEEDFVTHVLVPNQNAYDSVIDELIQATPKNKKPRPNQKNAYELDLTLSNSLVDFLCGKKNGKLNRIVKETAVEINVEEIEQGKQFCETKVSHENFIRERSEKNESGHKNFSGQRSGEKFGRFQNSSQNNNNNNNEKNAQVFDISKSFKRVFLSAPSPKQLQTAYTLLQLEYPAVLTFYLDERFHKRIIGFGGKNIQRIMKKHGVYIKFYSSMEPVAEDRNGNVVIKTPKKNEHSLIVMKKEIMSLVDESVTENYHSRDLRQRKSTGEITKKNTASGTEKIKKINLVDFYRFYSVKGTFRVLFDTVLIKGELQTKPVAPKKEETSFSESALEKCKRRNESLLQITKQMDSAVKTNIEQTIEQSIEQQNMKSERIDEQHKRILNQTNFKVNNLSLDGRSNLSLDENNSTLDGSNLTVSDNNCRTENNIGGDVNRRLENLTISNNVANDKIGILDNNTRDIAFPNRSDLKYSKNTTQSSNNNEKVTLAQVLDQQRKSFAAAMRADVYKNTANFETACALCNGTTDNDFTLQESLQIDQIKHIKPMYFKTRDTAETITLSNGSRFLLKVIDFDELDEKSEDFSQLATNKYGPQVTVDDWRDSDLTAFESKVFFTSKQRFSRFGGPNNVKYDKQYED